MSSPTITVPSSDTSTIAEKNQDDETQQDPLPPTNIPSIFRLIVQNTLPLGLSSLAANNGRHFSVITLCSGTDAPILAIRSVQEACISLGIERAISAEHICSVEIEAVKQAFIRRNVRPAGHIFRDVVDFAENDYAWVLPCVLALFDSLTRLWLSVSGAPRLTSADPDSTTAAGFKAKVPTNVDLLIVGSSCVDFSTLNPKKRHELRNSPLFPTEPVDPANPVPTLEAFLASVQGIVGESAVTFVSSMKYVLRVRPRLVVLENVNTAPWKNIAGDYFPMAQYCAAHVSVDSRDYGVPQTRQRGYCIAADWTYYGNRAADIVKEWAKIVRGIAPNTQMPLENLLLRPNDRAVREMEIPIERGSCREPSAKATMCKMRHKDAREMHALPDLNPVTGIDERGTCKPDDRIFGGWIQKQGSRVCDLLDIACMRTMVTHHLMFDARYKLHIIDLSQNVDRSLGQVGQSPCVTPAGIQFLTGQGRPLLGSEALALQGIDSSKLVPSTESEKDWRDLAGNAMTTTVIGSAILAAIVAEWNICKDEAIGLKAPAHDVIDDFRGEGRVECDNSGMRDVSVAYHQKASELFSVSIRQLLCLHQKSRSYCPCDGLGIRNRAKNLLLCVDCGEIRCKFCAGNPRHEYEPYPIGFRLNSQAETCQLLSSFFPPKFTLTTEEGEVGLQVPAIDLFEESMRASGRFAEASDRVSKPFEVCCRSVTYYYDGCHVGQDLTVFYTSERSFAHVVVSKAAVTWTIYMDVSKCRKVVRGDAMRVPCLRAVMKEPGFSHIPSKDDWLLWWDDRHEVMVETNKGLDRMDGIQYNILSITNSRGSEYVDPVVGEIVQGALSQTYELTEKCGTSHGVLYFSRSAGLYHFIQPHPSKDGSNDRYVIADSNRPLELFEQREPILIFPQYFRPIKSKWERIHKQLLSQKKRPDDGASGEDSKFEGEQPRQALQKSGKAILAKGAKAKKVQAVKSSPFDAVEPKTFICEFPGRWVRVAPQYRHKNSGADAVMVDVDSPRQIAPGDLVLLSGDPLEMASVNRCDTAVRWLHIVTPLKNVSWRNETHKTLWKPAFCVPHDDDGDTMMVPQPVRCKFFEVSTHNHDDLLSTFAFLFNALPLQQGTPVTSGSIDLSSGLCPRCVPKIPTLHRLRGPNNKVVDVLEDVVECETFEKKINERPAPLKIYVAVNDSEEEMKLHIELNVTALLHRAVGHLPREGIGMGVHRDPSRVRGAAEIVTNFIDSPGIFKPFETVLQSIPSGSGELLELLSFKENRQFLHSLQEDCVRWMIAREVNPKPFIEAEIEEHHEKRIGLRLLGRATIENRARGGILAHEVGFGKTVVTLALLDHERGRIQDSLVERQEWCGDALLHAKATLIIVPLHIVDQWVSEIRKFLGPART